jgi:hypothetical protein
MEATAALVVYPVQEAPAHNQVAEVVVATAALTAARVVQGA